MAEAPSGLRILMTTDAVGGVWTYSLDLARAFAAHGVETVLAVMGPPPAEAQALAARACRGITLLDTGLALDWLAQEEQAIRDASEALAAIAMHERCDVVQLHAPSLAAARCFSVPVVSVHHSCLATWWQAVHPGEGIPDDFRWRTALVGRGLSASDAVVAPTSALAHLMQHLYGLAARPHVIHNGREAPDHVPAEATRRARFVLASGRIWDAGKNFATLDRVAAFIDGPLLAAGPQRGPDGTAADLPNLQLLGTLEEADMRRWLSHAPVYASAALYEPFGLGILEAAQAGAALVLSDIPSLRELWPGAALFVPPSDAEAFAAALTRVLSDRGLERRLAGRARHRAALYSTAAMAEEMLRLHTRLAARRHEGAAA